MNSTRKLTLAALFLSLGLILPFFTGQIPTIGSQLLPMHIPVLLCGFVLGAPYGALVGFITPLLRSFIFGMPPIMTAIPMAFELCAYGFFSGYLYRILKKNVTNIYVSLLSAMILGRIVWGIVSMVLLGAQSFTFPVFVAGAITNAVAGIVIQVIIIPLIIMTLKKGNYIYE